MTVIQEFTVTIFDITEDDIEVLLEDKTNPDNYDEIAMIHKSEMPSGAIIEIGRMFKFKIFRHGGHTIELTDTGKWSEAEVKIAEMVADEYSKILMDN